MSVPVTASDPPPDRPGDVGVGRGRMEGIEVGAAAKGTGAGEVVSVEVGVGRSVPVGVGNGVNVEVGVAVGVVAHEVRVMLFAR